MNEVEIFEGALDVTDLVQRAAYLEAACGADLTLRRRIEHLLSLHESDQKFLESPLVDMTTEATMTFVRPLSDTSPSQLGPAEPATVELSRWTGSDLTIPGYDIEREIGRGGMGVVLKAHEKKLAREVAIKVLTPHLATQPESVQRFLREARSAASVRHEFVVTIYSVDDNSHLPFLVMEYIDGESLQQRLMRNGPLPPREAAEIARQIALGLAAAHAKGLVHRDVKPANVLLERSQPASDTSVGESCRVKLTDFGLARAVDDATITQSGFLAGTPQYMSPEQADAKPVDHRADLFSLGSVIFAMLTGEPPFAASSTVALLRQIVDAEPQSIGDRSVVDAGPLWLIVDKLLEKQPDQRFQLATEVAEELARYLADEPLRIAGVSGAASQTSASASSKRGRLARVGLAALLLIGTACLIPLMMDRGQEHSRHEPSDEEHRIESAPRGLEIANSSPSSAEAATGRPLGTVVDSATPDTASKTPTASETVPEVVVAKPHALISDDYYWAAATNLGPGVNTERSEDHACISADGLTLIFARSQNRSSDLWWSTRKSTDAPFETASPLPEGINTPHMDSDPFLSADGLSLWFASERPQGLGGTDIYVTRRASPSSAFDAPTLVPGPINSPDHDSSPFVAPDELTMMFARGSSPRRIYQAYRATKDEAFSEPRHLHAINRYLWHEFPRLMPDGLTMLVVVSQTPNVQQLWGSFRPTLQTRFGELVNLGPVINDNEGLLSGPSWCEATATLYFSSQRQGGIGRRDLWSARRVKKGSQQQLPMLSPNQSSPELAVAPFNSDAARQHQQNWAAHLQTKVEVENSIGMHLMLIPPGEFLMGAPDDDPDAQPQEKPQHQVRLTRPFFLGATEVTIGQFRKFVESEKYVTMAESDQLGAFDLNPKARRNVIVWNKLTEAGGDDCPVRCVGWEDAAKFCEWLSKSEGQTYRLPTDAEWEFACRAGTTSRYAFGNNFDATKANSNVTEPGRPRSILPVGTFTANAFGLFDMHGNVNEICWDAGRAFTLDAIVDPIGSLDPSQPAVVRGGAASSSAARLRSSQRYLTDARCYPATVFATAVKGFRVVRLVPTPKAP